MYCRKSFSFGRWNEFDQQDWTHFITTYRLIGLGWCARHCTSVNNLPDHILAQIFGLVNCAERSLDTLEQLRRISDRWDHVIRTHIYWRQRSLTLCLRTICSSQARFDYECQLESVMHTISQHLDACPNVHSSDKTLPQLLILAPNKPQICQLFPELRQLVLFVEPNHHSPLIALPCTLVQLRCLLPDSSTSLATISTLSQLRELCLIFMDAPGSCSSSADGNDPNLPLQIGTVLPALSSLSLVNYRWSASLASTLKSLQNCRKLTLRNCDLKAAELKQVFSKNKNLCKNLTHLAFVGAMEASTGTSSPLTTPKTAAKNLAIQQDLISVWFAKASCLQWVSLGELLITTDVVKVMKKLPQLRTLQLDSISFETKFVQTKSHSQSYSIVSLHNLSIRRQAAQTIDTKTFIRLISCLFPNLRHWSLASTSKSLLATIERNHQAYVSGKLQTYQACHVTTTNCSTPSHQSTTSQNTSSTINGIKH